MASTKGQLISKADWRAIDFPKKRTEKFDFLLFYSSRQTNHIRPFVFWENLRRANLLFGFISPLEIPHRAIYDCTYNDFRL